MKLQHLIISTIFMSSTTLFAEDSKSTSVSPQESAPKDAPAKVENVRVTKATKSKKSSPQKKKETSVKGLEIEELKAGTGKEATTGKIVKVHYTGWLTNGTKFDSSVDHGQPFEFHLGQGMVIKGWDLGVAGMKVGGKRKLTIAPELGYGARGVGPIPPNSTLLFDVELLEVK